MTSFAERYAITSVRGRVWSRLDVRRAALRLGRRSFLIPLSGRWIDAVIDDHEFMRRLAGQIPARVVEEVVNEAYRRRYRAAV